MPSKAIERENALQVARHEGTASRVVIVGRDTLTSGLLADELVRHLDCDAVALRSPDLLGELRTRKVDLVIISADLNSTPGTGLDLANAVSIAHPQIPIVVLLDHPARDVVLQAFRCGARGVFNREGSMTEFIDCIEHVRKGSIWAGKEETDSLLDAFKKIPAPGALTHGDVPALTARELEVVQCAARGKTNKAIASDLHLSEHTVKNYLFRSFEKLGVSSRIELLFYLAMHGHSLGSPNSQQEAPAVDESAP
jgi:DNA-binding NarL/FixJ family response regulator